MVSGQFSSFAPQHAAGSVVERNCLFTAVLQRRLNSDPVYAPNLASSHAPMSGSSIALKSGSDLTQPEQISKYGSSTSAHVALQVVGSPSGQSAASTQHAEFISSVRSTSICRQSGPAGAEDSLHIPMISSTAARSGSARTDSTHDSAYGRTTALHSSEQLVGAPVGQPSAQQPVNSESCIARNSEKQSRGAGGGG